MLKQMFEDDPMFDKIKGFLKEVWIDWGYMLCVYDQRE